MIIYKKTLYNYRLKTHPECVFNKQSCYNTKTGREIKQVYNNRCLGYNIRGKFISLTKLRNDLELIPKINTPF